MKHQTREQAFADVAAFRAGKFVDTNDAGTVVKCRTEYLEKLRLSMIEFAEECAQELVKRYVDEANQKAAELS